MAINAPSATITKSVAVTYTITYTDTNFNASTLSTGDVTINKTGTASGTVSISGTGNTRTVTINSITGDGTIGISLAAGTASDMAGNFAAAAGPSTTFIVDNTPPTVAISSPSANVTKGGPITYTVTYADTNFNSSTLAAGNVTLNTTGTATGTVAVTGSGTTRTVTISSITGDGTLGISLAGGTASDSAGNLAAAAGPSTTFIVDNTAPAVSISSPSISTTAAGPVTYTVTYTDTNFNSSTLAAGNITLNKTGTATGTVAISGSGSTRTVTISSIAGDGTIGISIAAGTASDTAGNSAGAAGPSSTFVVDNTAPAIAISAPSAASTRNGPVTYTVTYTDTNFSTSTLSAGDITLNKTGTANGAAFVSGTGNTRTVTLVGLSGDGTLGISLGSGTASDAAGNLAAAAGPSTTFIVDNTQPAVAISAPSTANTKAGPVTYTVTYTDANFSASTLAAGNITLNTSGTATGTVAVSGSGNTRTVSINTITGDGTLGISVGANTATDTAGNSAPAAGPSSTFIVDNTAPTISVSAPSIASTTNGPVTYTVTYADSNFNASTLATGNITLNTTGTATGTVAVSGSGNTRTVTISSITGDGTLGISIAAGTATDLAGNTAPAASPSTTFIVDHTAPVVSIGAASVAVTKSGPVTYTITYSDANSTTSTLSPADVTLNTTGTDNGVVNVSGSGSTRSVTIGAISGDGTLGISLAAGTATDSAGNPAPGAGPSGTFTVDNTPPTIAFSAPSVSVTKGGPVTYTVTYTDSHFNASTLSTADITLNKTGTANGSVAVGGSGNTRTVTISSIAGDGSLSISLASGTASDTVGNLAGSAGPSNAFSVDNTPPLATLSAPSAVAASSGPVTYTVTYTDISFNASTLSTTDITLNKTGSANGTVSVSGSGNTRTITIASITGDGTLSISIAAGTASDQAGNTAPSIGPGQQFLVDNTAPTVSISAPSVSTTKTGPVSYTVTYSDANFNSSTLVAGNVSLNTTGNATGTVAISGTGNTRTVTINSITGDGSIGISLASGTAADLAGNLAPGAGPSATFVVDNTPATVAIVGAPASSPEGTAIALTSTVTDPGTVKTFTYAWSVTKAGNAFGTTGSASTYTFTPDDNASYVVSLTVNDGTFNSIDTKTIAVTNVNPTAAIVGAPASSPEGTPISLTSTVTDPSSADTAAGFTYTWSVTKGGVAFGTNGSASTYSFTPDNNATFVVSLIAKDKDNGSSAAATATIIVTNVLPTVAINGAPLNSPEGTAIALTSTVSDPGSDTLTYTWSVTKNGTAFGSNGGGTAYSFTPDDNATYVVTLSVNDGTGSSTDSKTINVINVKPTAIITGVPSGNVNEGSVVNLSGATSTDPSPVDAASLEYAWSVNVAGQSYALGTTAAFTFTPDNQGSYIVTLTVTDKDGLSSTAQTTVTVVNVLPTVAIVGAPASSPEGSAINLTSTVFDPGTADPAIYTWSVTKNGSAFGTNGTVSFYSFTPDDNGTYVVTLSVFDGTGSSTDTKTIIVTNVNPTATIVGAPATSPVLSAISLTSIVTDPSTADTAAGFSYNWSVTKNGSAFGVNGNGAAYSFMPDSPGTFVVTLNATDKDNGSSGNVSKTITVTAPNIAFTPATLPNAEIATPFSQSLTGGGGTAPYTTFAIASGVLPTGISLSNGGTLHGIATAGGTYNFTVSAKDSSTGAGPYTGTQAYTLTVSVPTIVVAPATLPGAQVAASYNQSVSASGGTSTYTYAVTSGALPAGLTLSSSGTISGTPTAGGNFNVAITATDSSTGTGPFTGTANYTLSVAAPTISVAPNSIPGAQGGVPYSQTITAGGGTSTYSFAIASGALPAGLSLSSAGVIAGTPTAGGTFNVTITATDSSTGAGPYTGSKTYSLFVDAPIVTFTPAALPDAAIGSAYNQTISGAGGTAPYGTFIISAGALPAGIALSSSGVLSGTPIAAGTFGFTISAKDNSTGTGPFTGSQAYSLNVAPPAIAVSPAALPSGLAGTAYSQLITSSGGTATYSYAVTSGAIPPGLNLNSGGLITGTPTMGGTFNFSITATDSSTGTGPFTGSIAYTLNVARVATTIAASTANATFGSADQAVTLSAAVTSTYGTVNEGTVTFQLMNGLTNLGVAIDSTTVANGAATADYVLPGGTDLGTYTIVATYNGGVDYLPSSDNTAILQVAIAPTTTTVATANAPISDFDQNVTLSATVDSPGGPVSEGTVTFQVLNGTANFGSALVSPTTVDGLAAVTFVLPGGTPLGSYDIVAVYSGSPHYASSGDNTNDLNVNLTQPIITSTLAASGTVGFAFSYQLTATNLPTSFGATGLPAGLSFDPAAALISGTPTVFGTTLATLTATNVSGTDTETLTITIAPNQPPVVPDLSSDDNPAIINQTVSYTITATDADTDMLNYTFNFGDGSADMTGTFEQGTFVTLTHVYSQYTDGVPVTLTVTDGFTPVTKTVIQTVPMPASGAANVTNIALNEAPIVSPLDGLGIRVQASDGGVIQLGIDISSLTRDAYGVSTDWSDVSGRSATVTGTHPVHQYNNRGLFVATSTATNKTTNQQAGKARITLALSSKETGDYPANVTGPKPAERSAPTNNTAITTKAIRGKFSFTGKQPDVVSYSGIIALPAGLNMSQPHEFWIAIGNIVVETTIDKNGKGKAPGNPAVLKSLKVTSKVKKNTITVGGEPATVNVTYYSKGLVNDGYDTEGISNKSTDVSPGKSAPRKIQVAMLLDGSPFQAVTPVNFTVSGGSSGSDFGGMSGRSGK